MSIKEAPHKRYNILTGEWILVSPHRTKRPWQGKQESIPTDDRPSYEPDCYLCPGNTRANGEVNPKYSEPFSFTNDFAALIPSDGPLESYEEGLLKAHTETGICKVVCFSPNHAFTLPVMDEVDIVKVISLWQKEYELLGAKPNINNIQIFENKGAIMGCSNPHPHGQIWAQYTIPGEIQKKTSNFESYYNTHDQSLLEQYLHEEIAHDERIVIENEHFITLVPYWAVWPYELMIVPKRKMASILELSDAEKVAYANILRRTTIKFDNLFNVSFPYSAGIHQAPTDGKSHDAWHFHMSFYPPLLRSATVKKFMVGYEMFADPQRDITAEQAAETLRNLPDTHFSLLK